MLRIKGRIAVVILVIGFMVACQDNDRDGGQRWQPGEPDTDISDSSALDSSVESGADGEATDSETGSDADSESEGDADAWSYDVPEDDLGREQAASDEASMRIRALCRLWYECPEKMMDIPFFGSRRRGSQEECREQLAASGAYFGSGAGADEDNIDYDEAEAKRCLDELSDYLEGDVCEQEAPAPCDYLEGKLDVGTVCSSNAECRSDICYQALADGRCYGRCAHALKVGSECGESVDGGCEPGTICTPTPPSGRTCLPDKSLEFGDTCDSPSQCGDGLYCPCFMGGCGEDAQTCRRLVYAEEGEPCDQYTICPLGTHCYEAPEGTRRDHRCRPTRVEGDDCSDAINGCGGEAWLCEEGTCTVPPGEGETCNRSCASGLDCANGHCRPRSSEVCDITVANPWSF